jgi:cardiolipin synthase
MEERPASVAYCDPPSFEVDAQGHRFDFHADGKARLGALVELIDSAKTDLKLCYYIFVDDMTGRKVRDALLAAQGRGVAVSLIIDGFGSMGSDQLLAPIRDAGGTLLVFSARWNRSYLIRNHQKFVIADEKRALVGGFNISDAYFAPPAENGWNDLGVAIEGPVVIDLLRWFEGLKEWVGNPHAQWRGIRRRVRDWEPGTGPVRLLVGGPARGLNTWARSVKRDLDVASKVDLMIAYFSPSPGMIRRIRRAAMRGDTRLLLAGKSDNAATIGASRLMYRRLLERGAKIWEFDACKLHTKLVVIDDVVYFGSANFDMRSLFINLELMVRVEDPGLAQRVREFIGEHLPASHHITPAWHHKRATIWNRLRWTLSWFLVAVLDYSVARRANLGL